MSHTSDQTGDTRKRAVKHGPFSLPGTLLLLTCAAHAQDPAPMAADEPIHWALASVVGTGWYHVAGGRDALIFSFSPRQVLRETRPGGPGARQNGLWINYDAGVGLYDIDAVPGVINPDNLSSVSFTPGLEAEFSASERWTLRGYANLGWGTAIGDGDSAWIWYAGIKSRYRLGSSNFNWSLLNGLYYAGFNSDEGPSRDMTGVFAGVEFSQALREASPRRLHWHLGYTFLDDSVAFVLRDATPRTIGDTAELGLALGRQDGPLKLWFLEFDRLGLKYSFDTDGEFRSISLTFGSWFDS